MARINSVYNMMSAKMQICHTVGQYSSHIVPIRTTINAIVLCETLEMLKSNPLLFIIEI